MNEARSELKRSIIVAPVGAYVGRVKRGVEWALGLQDPRHTKVEISFVVDRAWMADPQYNDVIQKLKGEFDDAQLKSQFKALKVGQWLIDMEDETSCTAWLLKNLAVFLQRSRDGHVFVDMTSAPKEWIFACHYVAEFFDKESVTFYYVGSRRRLIPQDFKAAEEVNDPGTVPQSVILSGPDSVLREWITEGTENWTFFRAICTTISAAAAQSGRPIIETAIPFASLAAKASEWMKWEGNRASKKRVAKQPERSRSMKSISKRLTEIGRFGLFIETLRTIQFTHRGYALAKAIFELP